MNRMKPPVIPQLVLGIFSLLFAAQKGVSGFPARACDFSPPKKQDSREIKFDFETGDLQGWIIVEGDFGKLVCDRAFFHNTGQKYNKEGRYFLSTLDRHEDSPNDGFVGVVESPLFVLEGSEISFLVGGGSHENTYIALCTQEGREVLKAGGKNDETMVRIQWDVSGYKGRKVSLRVVDRNRGSWGHITLDDVRAEGTLDQKATEQRNAPFLAEREKRERERIALEKRQEQERARKLEELRADQNLFAEGSTRIYRGEHLSAISIPIGGIGAGTIQMNGKAERSVWQIFNNFNPLSVPNSFFAVRIGGRNREPAVRALQTTAAGPFPAMQNLSFRGEYPFAWYDFEDENLPVRLQMEAFSPLVPLSTKDSAIPCAVFRFTAENAADDPVEVCFLAVQQNAVGFTGSAPVVDGKFQGYGGNRNRIVAERNATILHMTADRYPASPGFGDMVLMTTARDVSGTASWSTLDELWEDFRSDGALEEDSHAGPSPEFRTLDGALAARITLDPGENGTVPFVLTWFFPNANHGNGEKWSFPGNMYANWWRSAFHVAIHLVENLDRLEVQTRLYHRTFYESNLPHWLLDRISSQIAVLRSKTCFWAGNGYFGAWEGCCPGSGCCHGTCTHVWHYAQAHARLFPEIARNMREATYSYQHPDGALPYRHPDHPPAFDGQCGDILGAYREHLCSNDGKWLSKIWPKVKKAMDHTIRQWDGDEDGVLSGAQHNTLDGSLGGSTSWLGTMYLSALAASEKMAVLQGDREASIKYRGIRQSGKIKQNDTLWNGEYYVQIRDPQPREDYGEGCSIDQALGEWWANQVGIEVHYPPERVRSALRSLMKYNFKANFHGILQSPRKFVDDDDAGMQMITWPKGPRPRPTIRYGDEVMTGFEYAAAATMIQYGMVQEGFLVAKAVRDRYDGRLRQGLDPRKSSCWGYSGNPFGDDECGKFYARALSVWSILLACQGFLYDGPASVIGFKPVWKPEEHRSFFTAAEGWGLFTQTRKEGEQAAHIDLRYGKLDVGLLEIALAEKARPSRVSARKGRSPIQAEYAFQEPCLRISLTPKVTLKAGEVLSVEVKTRQEKDGSLEPALPR